MCGINGCLFIGKKDKDELQSIISSMNKIIIHRGPDDMGDFICSSNDYSVALGMRRLSIIDINGGNQPKFNYSKSIVIVFNGEIYNYKELRKSLENKGIRFNSNSDTEVILRLYENAGVNSFKKLDGMFAFSIFDKSLNKIFVARDRFGEKPLYYYKDENKALWASELKSIINNFPELKIVSKPALNLFLSLTYIPAPYTIYENIFKLKPAHFLEIDVQNISIKEKEYWNIDLNTPVDLTDYNEAKRELKKLLFDSVEKRMISDVPLGVFLSGGVDSTIIAAIMSQLSERPIKTFSVAYSNPRYDESGRAKLVAEHIKSEHHEYILNYDEILQDIDKIILNYDEPYADSSCLPTYYISKKTVGHVKVALTGDGGDEVFGGYNKYLIHTYGKIYQRFIPAFLNKFILKSLERISLGNKDSKGPITKARKLLNSIGNSTLINHLNIISLGFKNNELQFLMKPDIFQDTHQILSENFSIKQKFSEEPLKLARLLDMHISLEGDMLVKVDRASMLNSLECRTPFLDHRLMELSFRMPDSFLIKGLNKKRILKDTFKDLLPKDFFKSSKSGFEVPVSHWLRNELREELLEVLSESNLAKHNYFQYYYVEKLIKQHLFQNMDQSVKLWTLFCFQKWYNHNIDS